MDIVALDLSLSGTGVVTKDGARTIKTKPADFSCIEDRFKYIITEMPFFDSMYSLTTKETVPDLVILEGLAFASKTGQAAERAGLHHLVRYILRDKHIPFVLVPPTTLKLWTTGKGNADKDTVLLAIARLFPDWEITNNNEADALGLYSLAKEYYRESMIDVPAKNKTALDKIDWPKLNGKSK